MDSAATQDAPLAVESYLARFGLSEFRPGQKEVIETILAGQDCLCVMPTGGGKSLCYQLPALVRPGVTLVVSPLIALMKDQVDQLEALGLPATLINSTLSPEEQSARLEGMAAGRYTLVYVVPERFRSPRFLEAIRRCKLRLLAIDEAHCISEWGHDFRPDYARLGQFRGQMGNPPTIALTATATAAVRRDIVELLHLKEPKAFVTGFARPNLYYEVQSPSSQKDKDKDEALVKFLAGQPGSGIVYASTRKRCEEVAQTIAARTRRKVGVYHAGMLGPQRREAQEDFMQSRTEIVVATMAFGMGIDKANVRFVVHYNLPGSLEAYYQEAGRAGRDGLMAHCLLLGNTGDRYLHEFFIESAYPSSLVVKQVYNYLRNRPENPIELTQQAIKEDLKLAIGNEGVGACEKLLEKAGAIDRLESVENMAAVRLNSDMPSLVDYLPSQAKVKRKVLRALEKVVGQLRHEWVYFQPRRVFEQVELDAATFSRTLRELTTLESVDYIPPFRGRAIHMRERSIPFEELEIDFEAIERRKAAEYERLNIMIRFAQTRACRQQEILHYFGEPEPTGCGHCDNCSRKSGPEPAVRMTGGDHAGLLEAVRIVLSGAARARGRCGKQLLAQMLCGSTSEKVTRNRLDKLSTYGLLAHLKQTEVVELIDAAVAGDLLESSEVDRFRPVLNITPSGTEIMSGRAQLSGGLPISDGLLEKLERSRGAATGESTPASAIENLDREVLGRLRDWRDALSREREVPAYVVLPNAALDELAQFKPKSLEALGRIKGIGESRLRQFGQALLGILHGQAASPVLPEPLAPEERESDNSEADGPGSMTFASAGQNSSEPEYTTSDDPDAQPHYCASELFEANDEPEPSVPSAGKTAAAAPKHATVTLPSGTQVHPSHYWTWRLLSGGFTPDECAAIRGISTDVVLDHALRSIDSNWPVEPGWFLSDSLMTRLEKLIGADTPPRIRPLLSRLPKGTRYEHVQLFIKCRDRSISLGS